MATANILNPLQLGDLLGRGGQGSVYRIVGRDDEVIKVYHPDHQPTPTELRRLDRLIAANAPPLLACCAWPLRRLRVDDREAVVMRRIVESQELHMLIDRSSRIEHFRHADWKFMVQAAQRLAQACSLVHGAGLLLVDISEKNVMVNRAAEINLIDCDGFVFEGGGAFGCSTTFTLQWTAPELRGKPLASTERTANHDNYALARALFKLLFQGSEPMQLVHGDSDMPGERVFVFSRLRPSRPAKPWELTLDVLPPPVADLFEQAFDPARAAPAARPTAAQWARALSAMVSSMCQCPQASTHSFVRGLAGGCPWCARARIQPDFDDFHDETRTAVNGAAAIDATLAGLLAQRDPTARGAQQTPPVRRWRRRLAATALGVGALATTALMFLATDGATEPQLRERSVAFVTEHFAIINNLQSTGSELVPRYAPDAQIYDGRRESQPGPWFSHVVRVWTTRRYDIIPDSMTINCDQTRQRCIADVVVRYQVRSNDGKRRRQGCWNYVYKLDLARRHTLIAAEKKGPRTVPGCPN